MTKWTTRHKSTTISLKLLTAIFALLALAACGSSKSSSTLDGPKETVALYNARCISCHATDLSGKVGPDSDLRTVGSRMTKEQIVQEITNGGDIMPAFASKLNADEINALADWLSKQQ
ncbi:cytochrome c551 [Paenibacillus cellulosilyticus]|uniref:Cytochrome c551 n=1 Tax=Paenibacillus cellulosilyticus TaxID=375489 RepID=A0A2V2YNA0_9BACL|nr:cytochrome c [Paenibacillus cellulosilyticus]PWV97300.1 cytochrome c551 [Paenibacillus cellulosilyticus]QKS47498.1 cytochrome c [Paenibacillus cellulosilyticus]